MNSNPTISVIMSTYNTPDEWLEASVNSILNQTYSDFEFIIIDDCSTTDLNVIKEKCIDDRIVWLRNEENIGLTKSLNKALAIAKGKYIARMDSDDISLPERFEVQAKFMDEHPEIIVCGSYRRAFGKENKDEIWNIPVTREEQQVQLFFYNCGITHPTAMFRKSMLDEFGIRYNENYKKAQDYGIWVQCTRYAPMAMIHKVLLQYRKSDGQVTANRSGVKVYDSMVKIDQLVAMGLDVTEEEKEMHIRFCDNKNIRDVKVLKAWIHRLVTVNKTSNYFADSLFQDELAHRWYLYCRQQYLVEKDVSYRDAYLHARTIKEWMKEVFMLTKQKIKGRIRR